MTYYEKRSEERNDATFNMALAYLERLNRLLNLACISSLSGDLSSWFTSLQALHREISPKLKEPTNKSFLNKFAILSPLINAFQTAKIKGIISEKTRLGNVIYPSLINLDIELKKEMDDSKFLMPKADDPRYALGGR